MTLSKQQQEELSNFHGEIAERITPGYIGFESYFEHIERYRLGAQIVNTAGIVVDIACGTGYGSNYLVMSGISKVVGVDRAESVVAYANNTYAKKLNNLYFIAGDAFGIPLAPETADTVVSFETIEHISESDNFLRQIYQILKPNGSLVISTPNKAVSTHYQENPFHINEMLVGELVCDLERQGFRIQKIFGQGKINTDESQTATSRLQLLVKSGKSILPSSIQDYLRRSWLLPRRTGIPKHVFKWYYTSPYEFENWIIENDFKTVYKPQQIEINALEQNVQHFRTFIIVAQRFT